VMVATSDRMQIPTIEYFWKLVHEFIPPGSDRFREQIGQLTVKSTS